MPAIFYIIGYLTVAVGLAWATLGLFQPYEVTFGPGAEILARALIMTPGLSVAGAGMLLLALGGVLSRLDRIVQNTEAGRAPSRGPALD